MLRSLEKTSNFPLNDQPASSHSPLSGIGEPLSGPYGTTTDELLLPSTPSGRYAPALDPLQCQALWHDGPGDRELITAHSLVSPFLIACHVLLLQVTHRARQWCAFPNTAKLPPTEAHRVREECQRGREIKRARGTSVIIGPPGLVWGGGNFTTGRCGKSGEEFGELSLANPQKSAQRIPSILHGVHSREQLAVMGV
jgi:hypothetical protein